MRIKSEKFGTFNFILDNDDIEKVKSFHWSVFRTHNKYNTSEFFYASTCDKRLPPTHRLLHRFINNTTRGFITDHIDGNTLNTRKNNLRACTYKDNGKNKITPCTNKSGHKGVYWDTHSATPKWVAFIKVDDKYHSLGRYDDYCKAVEARIKAEIEIQGEFSRDYGSFKIESTRDFTQIKYEKEKIK